MKKAIMILGVLAAFVASAEPVASGQGLLRRIGNKPPRKAVEKKVNNSASDENARQETEKILDRYVAMVDAFRANHEGRLPNEEEMNSLRSEAAKSGNEIPMKDGWGNRFVVLKSAEKFIISSAGPDGCQGTKDDIVRGDTVELNWHKSSRRSSEEESRKSAKKYYHDQCIRLFALRESIKEESEEIQIAHGERLEACIDFYCRGSRMHKRIVADEGDTKKRLDELLRKTVLSSGEKETIAKEVDAYIAEQEAAKRVITEKGLKALYEAAEKHMAEGKGMMSFSEEVWRKADPSVLPVRDGWNYHIIWKFEDGKFQFVSSGPDGKRDTDDDIVVGNFK